MATSNFKMNNSSHKSQQPQVQIADIQEKDGYLTFTISGVNVSFVNAIRRAILANLSIVVFKTAPYEESKAIVLKNTISGINNEFIKHRLSGIPIHIVDVQQTPLQNYLLELNVENKTDTILLVTTKDFKIKNTITDKYLSETDTRNIFPPNDITGDHILFLKLKPQLAETIPGESIHLTCEFSREMSGSDGMYVQASTCAYGNTVDKQRMDMQLVKEIQKWREDKNNSKEQIDLMISNWRLLDGRRIFIENSFDFILESIGVYSNKELMVMACNYLIEKLKDVQKFIAENNIRIESTKTTLPNSFNIFLENGEDYTIGGILEHLMFVEYCNVSTSNSTSTSTSTSTSSVSKSLHIMNFVGLKKYHPHDNFIVLRIGYVEPTEQTTALQHLNDCAIKGIDIIHHIRSKFQYSKSKSVIVEDVIPVSNIAKHTNLHK